MQRPLAIALFAFLLFAASAHPTAQAEPESKQRLAANPEQLVLGHGAVGMLDQVDQRGEDLGLERNVGCQGFYAESREELAPALEQARDADGPAALCLRTSREANLATPMDPVMRFIEVYQGPLG